MMRGLGRRLRERARELNLTDAEVARRAGLTTRRYGHYVTDRNEPDLETLLSLCAVLETSPDHLLGLEDGAGGATQDHLRTLRAINAQLRQLDTSTLKLAKGLIAVLVRGRS